MNKNMMEMMNKNKEFERMINELRNEVRGYKDAVSENSASARAEK